MRERTTKGQFLTTHGKTGTPEHRAWKSMIARCYSPGQSAYEHYGGRGIAVCERWRASFLAFLEDMGLRPSTQHSIDRINNDGHYEPDNCHWATKERQARNKRSNTILEIRGVSATLSEWARWSGLKRLTLRNRIKSGWPIEIAISGALQQNGATPPEIDESNLLRILGKATACVD